MWQKQKKNWSPIRSKKRTICLLVLVLTLWISIHFSVIGPFSNSGAVRDFILKWPYTVAEMCPVLFSTRRLTDCAGKIGIRFENIDILSKTCLKKWNFMLIYWQNVTRGSQVPNSVFSLETVVLFIRFTYFSYVYVWVCVWVGLYAHECSCWNGRVQKRVSEPLEVKLQQLWVLSCVCVCWELHLAPAGAVCALPCWTLSSPKALLLICWFSVSSGFMGHDFCDHCVCIFVWGS